MGKGPFSLGGVPRAQVLCSNDKHNTWGEHSCCALSGSSKTETESSSGPAGIAAFVTASEQGSDIRLSWETNDKYRCTSPHLGWSIAIVK